MHILLTRNDIIYLFIILISVTSAGTATILKSCHANYDLFAAPPCRGAVNRVGADEKYREARSRTAGADQVRRC